MRTPEEIAKEAERIRAEIETRKSSYAAAIEVAELAELIRDLARHAIPPLVIDGPVQEHYCTCGHTAGEHLDLRPHGCSKCACVAWGQS
jgi:hypothetical protein